MSEIFQLRDGTQRLISDGVGGIVISHIISIVHQMDEDFNADLPKCLRSRLLRSVDTNTTLHVTVADRLKYVDDQAIVEQDDEQMMRYGKFAAVAAIADRGRAVQLISQYLSLYEHKKNIRRLFADEVPHDTHKLRFLADWIEQDGGRPGIV